MVAALIANAIPYALLAVAEQTVASSLAGTINATTPLWTAVIGGPPSGSGLTHAERRSPVSLRPAT